jgi:hypothetical protein
MDTALTREAVMSEIEATWNKLQTLLVASTEEQLTQPTDAVGWTAKDHSINSIR